MDNQAIARVFGEIADLLEIKGENPFKIRAYRNAADVIATCAEVVALMSDVQVRALSGVGKDLALKIREIVATGRSTFHQELLAEFPSTMLDLLTLQGVGPKTVALLYSSLNISSLDALEAAAKAGRIRELKGMGSKKEQLILRALTERRAHAGRRLLAEVAHTAVTVVEHLRERAPTAQFEPVGSLRRGQDTCGDLDILAIGADVSIMDAFTTQPLAERIIGKGETKSSVLLQGGLQADLRLVSPDNRGAALQYFTGSKSHNIVLRDRALQRGLKLNEYGLYRHLRRQPRRRAHVKRIFTRPWIWRGSLRSCGRTVAKSKPPSPVRFPHSSSSVTSVATCIRTPPKQTAETRSRR